MVALAALLAACTGGGEEAAVDISPSSAAIAEAARVGLAVGDTAPALSGPGLLGGTVDLASLRGRPVLVNFWASNCIPCRREFPLLADVARGGRVTIVGVAVLDRREDAARYLGSLGAWNSILDRPGTVAARWRVRVLPVTYAIRADGTIGDRQFGEVTRPGLDRMLRAIGASV